MRQATYIIKYLALGFAISLIITIFTGIYEIGNFIAESVSQNKNPNENNFITYTVTDNSESIYINLKFSDLKIIEGDYIKLTTNDKYIEFTNKIKEIKITDNNRKFSKNTKYSTTLTLPNSVYKKIFIDNGAGKLNIEKINTDILELNLGAGSTNLNNLTVNKKTEIDSGAGSLNINNSNLSNLDLDIGVGSANIETRLVGISNINNGIGSVNINILDSKDNYKIEVEKGIGTININNEKVKNDTTIGNGINLIDLESGIGTINMQFLN